MPPPTRRSGVAPILQDPPYGYSVAQAVREIQEDEDRRILECLEGQTGWPPGRMTEVVGLERTSLDLESIREAVGMLHRQSLRSSPLVMSQQDYADILALPEHERRQILPLTVSPGSDIQPGDQITVEGLSGSFAVHERIGVAAINPRGLERLGVQRVMIPEFEIQSNPTIAIGEIRSRRFSLIDRNPMDPDVQRILDAVFRAKSAPELPPIRQASGSPRSVWEALVELDLVDVGSA